MKGFVLKRTYCEGLLDFLGVTIVVELVERAMVRETDHTPWFWSSVSLQYNSSRDRESVCVRGCILMDLLAGSGLVSTDIPDIGPPGSDREWESGSGERR